MDTQLEMYKILYQAYSDEIKNLWQRSIFLGAFMVLVWSGYGALQLKTFDKDFEISASYCAMSLGLCVIVIVISLLWIAMAKGSKFVQEAHEAKIRQYIKRNRCNLFCDLDIYEKAISKGRPYKIPFICPLKSYRYSPSKINIALGWASLIISTIFLYIHLFIQTSLKEIIQECLNLILSFDFILVCPLIFVVVVALVVHFTLRGKKTKLSWCKKVHIKIRNKK